MSFIQLLVLSVVQGVTEFLPISSSGHLVLVPMLTNWTDQGLILDVAVHMGTLLAVMLYFWRDLLGMLTGLGRLLKGRQDPGATLTGLLIVATIPAIIVGFFVNKYFEEALRSLEVVAWATLVFGLFLWISDKTGMTVRRIEHLKMSDAVIIGLFQVLALIPGTSRSGITMSAGRMLSMERPDAARFSMLLSIPTILGAGVLKGWDLWQTGSMELGWAVLWAVGMAFVSALATIALLMAWLQRSSFTPFVIYRILLGGALLVVVYAGHG